MHLTHRVLGIVFSCVTGRQARRTRLVAMISGDSPQGLGVVESPNRGTGRRKMHDIDVRAAVRARLAVEHAGDTDTRIVEEMGVWAGTVRVDMAVINGELAAYELKSDSDTLERLPYQAEIYSKVFDRVTLVAGSKHYKKALKIIPRWWGCNVATMCDGAVSLRVVRAPKRNPALDAGVLVQLLCKEEAVALLAEHELARGWRSRTMADICTRIVSEVSQEDISAHVRSALKARPKLGQVVTSDLNVPVEIQTNPSAGIARRGGSCRDVVDLSVSSARTQHEATGSKSNDILGVAAKLRRHRARPGPLDLDALENNELGRERVLGVDRNRVIDIGGRSGGNAAVIAEVKMIRQTVSDERVEQRQLVSRKPRRAKRELGLRQVLRDAPADHGNRAPSTALQKRRKERRRDAKGRYISDVAL